ncbi:MAG TPA: DeoR/GlpR transcriptional regulator, partial [Bacilli bacterium]
VSNKSMERELPYSEREINCMHEKINIAREAVNRVVERDVILLDASTTAWQMARLLPDMRITVLTNAMKVALELAERSKIKVIFTGGTLSAPSLSFIGPLAEKTLQEYHVNKLFFSCKGVDLDRGLSDSNESHALLKRCMMTIADQSYLLADHTKFGVKALTMFSPLKDLHEIITDVKLDSTINEQLTSLNMKVSKV